MNSTRSRRGFLWAYQIAAVCLLILSVTPLTARFATCDIANAVLHAGLDDTDSVKDKMMDSGLVPLRASVGPYLSLCAIWDGQQLRSALDGGALPQVFPLRL